MSINTGYDRLISRVAWRSVRYYVIPLVVLMVVFEVARPLRPYFDHMVIVYCFGSVIHALVYGLQAVCAQVDVLINKDD